MKQITAYTEKEAWEFMEDNSTKLFKFEFHGFSVGVESTNLLRKLQERGCGLVDCLPLSNDLLKLISFMDCDKSAYVIITIN